MPRTFLSRGIAVFCLIICPVICIHAQQPMTEITPVVEPTKNFPQCSANPHASYPKPTEKGLPNDKGACYIEIDRNAPVTPTPLNVHAGTRVFVIVRNPRPNEVIQANVSFSRTAPPDIASDVLKNSINPLQTITLSPKMVLMGFAPDPCEILDGDKKEGKKEPKNIIGEEKEGEDKEDKKSDRGGEGPAVLACEAKLLGYLTGAQESINEANSALGCLENYRALLSSAGQYSCSPAISIDPKGPKLDKTNPNAFRFDDALQLTQDTIRKSVNEPVPARRLSQMDAYLSKLTSLVEPDCKHKTHCILTDDYDSAQTLLTQLKNLANTIQSAQATLQQTSIILSTIPGSALDKEYYFDVPSLRVATATISGIETVTKTSSTISTWTTTSVWQRFVFSTGLGFSRTVNRTFANTGQFQGGKPVLDSNGNAVSTVTETDNHFSVAAPEVMGSILIPGLTRLEAKCSLGCSFLLSGGIGANLNTKSAEFDTGISFRFMNFLLTPSVHWGREAQLIDGFTVGSPSGANAPSSLPTVNKWARRKGLVLTYVIPLT